MNELSCNDITITLHHKDFNINVRTYRNKWELFKQKAAILGYKPSELINLLIDTVNSGKFNIEGRSVQVNLNVTPVMQKVEQKVDMREYITETEIMNWFRVVDRRLEEGRGMPPLVREKIMRLATRLKRPKKEIFEKIRKLNEFERS